MPADKKTEEKPAKSNKVEEARTALADSLANGEIDEETFREEDEKLRTQLS